MIVTRLAEALAGSSTIVLSCKPQNLAGVFRAASGHIGDESLVVSIIAGCTIDTLQAGLGARGTIVRSMPNTPAMVREGITAWTATAAITDEQRARTRALLGSFGEEIFVGDESYLDMATALSGSGPACVCSDALGCSQLADVIASSEMMPRHVTGTC